MKLTIDRSKWLRGEGSDESYLLRESDGKMCCVGFFAIACGVSPDEIRGKKGIDMNHHKILDDCVSFSCLPNPPAKMGRNKYRAVPVQVLIDLYNFNDFKDVPEGQREMNIQDSFKTIGVEVTFVDGPLA